MFLYSFNKVGEDLIITSPMFAKRNILSAIVAKETRKSLNQLSVGERAKYLRIAGMLGFHYLLPEFLDIDLYWPLFNFKEEFTKETYKSALHDNRNNCVGHFILYPEDMNINMPQDKECAIINKYHPVINSAENEAETDHTQDEVFRFKISDASQELKDLIEKYHPGLLTSKEEDVVEDIVEDTITPCHNTDIISRLNNLLTAAELLHGEALELVKELGNSTFCNKNSYHQAGESLDRTANRTHDTTEWDDFKEFAYKQFAALADTPTTIQRYMQVTGIRMQEHLVKALLRQWREDFVRTHNIDITPYMNYAPKGLKLINEKGSKSHRKTLAMKRAIEVYMKNNSFMKYQDVGLF